MARARARSAEAQLRVGRLTKAHGLKGGMKLELFTDDPARRFTPGASFSLQVPDESPWHGKRLELAELRWYNGHPVGFFAGVTDRTAAESLAKAILWVDTDPDEPAEPDAWYDHQLIGLDVVRDGTLVGVVDRLEHLPAQDLLVITAGEREVLVPFVKAIVPEVDLERGRVLVTPPDGLFEDLPEEDADVSDEQGTQAAEGIDGDAAVAPAAPADPSGSQDGAADADAASDAPSTPEQRAADSDAEAHSLENVAHAAGVSAPGSDPA